MLSLGALGIGLTIVFGGFVLLLVAELYYLLCWKRRAIANPRVNSDRIVHQNAGNGGGDLLSNMDQLPGANFHAELVAKLFPLRGSGEMEFNHLLDLPRLLFTIKEETKEDLDSDDSKSKTQQNQQGFHNSKECILFISSESATPQETPFVTPPSSPSLSPSSRSPILSPLILQSPTGRSSSPHLPASPHFSPMLAFASPAAVLPQTYPLGRILPPFTSSSTPPLRSALSSPFETTSPLYSFQRSTCRSFIRE